MHSGLGENRVASIPLQYTIDAMGSCITISDEKGNCSNGSNAIRNCTIAVSFIVLLIHGAYHIINSNKSS